MSSYQQRRAKNELSFIFEEILDKGKVEPDDKPELEEDILRWIDEVKRLWVRRYLFSAGSYPG
jgi:hypothetical protein